LKETGEEVRKERQQTRAAGLILIMQVVSNKELLLDSLNRDATPHEEQVVLAL
jgi:hypothetical protein